MMMTHGEILAAVVASRPGRRARTVAVAALDAAYGPTRFERRGTYPASEIKKYTTTFEVVYNYIDRVLRDGR